MVLKTDIRLMQVKELQNAPCGAICNSFDLRLYVLKTNFWSSFEWLLQTGFYCIKQVAQWATIAHHGASIMFGDTIIYDAQRQITLNLKQ